MSLPRNPLARAVSDLATVPADQLPGATYSPGVLLLIRWLAMKPNGTPAEIARSHESSLSPIQGRLNRMRSYGLVQRNALGEWSLTELGRRFRLLIDESGVI